MGLFLNAAVAIAFVINFNFVQTIPVEINRIVNGKPAEAGQFPYQALILIKLSGTRKAVCGGSLIDPSWILTAAHCAVDAVGFKIHLGARNYSNSKETGRIVVESNVKIVHKKYNPSVLLNDLALIKLPEPIVLSETIQPIALPFQLKGNDLTGKEVIASGWGLQYTHALNVAQQLQYAPLRVITNDECRETFGGIVGNSVLCTKGEKLESVCSGDSGGPLVLNLSNTRYLVGVTSFGHIYGCDNGLPNGFSRVTNFLDWIKKNTGI